MGNASYNNCGGFVGNFAAWVLVLFILLVIIVATFGFGNGFGY